MEQKDIARIEQMAESKGHYRPEAYFWVLRVLEFAHTRMRKEGHVSGRELLEGVRLLGLEEYGPMALEVFHHWGLRRTDDIGRIVFDMVENGLLSKTEEDRQEDFTEVYDFEQVFVREVPW